MSGFDVRVNLRGRDVAVTEHFLDSTQIGAVLQQMRGETMTQSVRRNPTRKICPRRISPHERKQMESKHRKAQFEIALKLKM